MAKDKQQDTYRRAMSKLMSHLLFKYLRKEHDFTPKKDGNWKMAIGEPVPEGALVVPFAITDAREWWLGWYRGKNEEGYDLIESVETHQICRFGNTGYLFLNNLEVFDSPIYHYSDREYDMIDTIEKRVAKNNYWFVVGNPTFHEDGSIDIPIRQKFTDDFYTRTYRNFRAVTIKALDEHCNEAGRLAQEKEAEKKKENKTE